MRRTLVAGLAGMALCWSGAALAQGAPSSSPQTNAEQENASPPSAQQGQPQLPGMQEARQALADVAQAQTALGSCNTSLAQGALERAAGTLRHLYDLRPAAGLVNRLHGAEQSLEAGHEPDLAPLAAEVQSQSLLLDPSVVAHVKSAQQRAAQNPRAAAQALRVARQRIEVDLATLPVEDAYARVRAAQVEISHGQSQLAQQLLGGIPINLSEVQFRRPLVPVRFDLQAAAAAAQAGNYDEARTFLDRADNRIAALRDQSSKPISDQLECLHRNAAQLESQIRSGSKPSVSQIRSLAQATNNIQVG